MPNSTSFQVHANVNSDHGDNALRVTITFYDETGASVAHQTWRAHSRAVQMDGSVENAYVAVQELLKMLSTAWSSAPALPPAPDTPLDFG